MTPIMWAILLVVVSMIWLIGMPVFIQYWQAIYHKDYSSDDYNKCDKDYWGVGYGCYHRRGMFLGLVWPLSWLLVLMFSIASASYEYLCHVGAKMGAFGTRLSKKGES